MKILLSKEETKNIICTWLAEHGVEGTPKEVKFVIRYTEEGLDEHTEVDYD